MGTQCWFCKDNDTEMTTPVFMKKGSENICIDVPLCETCKSKQTKAAVGFFVLFAIGVIAAIITGIIYYTSEAEIHGMRTGMSIAGLILAPTTFLGIFVAKSYIKGTHFPKYAYKHPDVIAKQEEGYK